MNTPEASHAAARSLSTARFEASWEGFHAMWPAIIIQRLLPQLPEDYVAEPRVHLGTNFEIDDCTFENSYPATKNYAEHGENGGIATAIWAPPEPTLAVDADPTEQYAYEVLVFDESRTRQLVAVVELVSPGNKDRPESRRDFVAKCAALLGQNVCVSIVDLVTTRQFETWAFPLVVGQPLPTLPLWLTEDRAISLDLEASYEDACRALRIA